MRMKAKCSVLLFAVLGTLAGGSVATLEKCLRPNWTVFATGLTNPRHIRLGPDRQLYVAEAGVGGDLEPTCETPNNLFTQGGALPYKGGFTARISRIRRDGGRETVASRLPSFYDQVTLDALGVSDLAWIRGQMYALVEGGGCTRGFRRHPAGIVRINANGSYTYVADITAFIRAKPVANEPACGLEGDCEPDGVPHSLLAVGDRLYVVETNHNSVLRVDPRTGAITRLYDLSVQDLAPTILTRHEDNFYLGGFDGFIQAFNRSLGPVRTFDEGYGPIVEMTFIDNRIHVLETFALETPWTPGTGRVIRRNRDGSRTVIACGLDFPIGMARRYNELFVSTLSYGQGPVRGLGQIVRIDLEEADGEDE